MRHNVKAGRLPELSDTIVAKSKQAVLEVYPLARWQIVDDEHGRIVAGDRLVSLKFQLCDELAENLGWIDAATRLGASESRRSMPGDQCGKPECSGVLIVYATKSKGTMRTRYLHCPLCGYLPADSKWVTLGEGK